MVVELPEELERAVKFRALQECVSPDMYVRAVLQRELAPVEEAARKPYITGRGSLAKYGPAPSAEEIDENRAEMFRGFGENF